jgi:hypothetical protein
MDVDPPSEILIIAGATSLPTRNAHSLVDFRSTGLNQKAPWFIALSFIMPKRRPNMQRWSGGNLPTVNVAAV